MRLHRKPWSIKHGLLLLLLAGAISSCAMVPLQSPYRVTIPQLQAAPSDYTVSGVKYRAVLKSDWDAVVRELKAACLALNGTPKECQTE